MNRHRKSGQFRRDRLTLLLAAVSLLPLPQLASADALAHPQAITGRLAERVTLGDGLRTYHPSLHQLGVSYADGQSDQTPLAQVHFQVNPATLKRYLLQIAPLVRRRPIDAHPILEPNQDDDLQQVPARIFPGHDGAVLETAAAERDIEKDLTAHASIRHIVLPVKTTPQKITARDLQGINGRIGVFVTRYDPYLVGRTQTVRLAFQKINDLLLQPGQVFSLNKAVGPRDPAHGFDGKSDVFIDGKMAMQYGGGMCQVATTVFNAAMLADLKIVERHAHIRTVPYAEPGSDATVYYGEKDLKFANDTDAPVFMTARTTPFHCIVDIFGKMVPGRKVKIERSYVQLAPRHVIGTIERVVEEPDGVRQKGPYFKSNYKWTAALSYKTHTL